MTTTARHRPASQVRILVGATPGRLDHPHGRRPRPAPFLLGAIAAAAAVLLGFAPLRTVTDHPPVEVAPLSTPELHALGYPRPVFPPPVPMPPPGASPAGFVQANRYAWDPVAQATPDTVHGWLFTGPDGAGGMVVIADATRQHRLFGAANTTVGDQPARLRRGAWVEEAVVLQWDGVGYAFTIMASGVTAADVVAVAESITVPGGPTLLSGLAPAVGRLPSGLELALQRSVPSTTAGPGAHGWRTEYLRRDGHGGFEVSAARGRVLGAEEIGAVFGQRLIIPGLTRAAVLVTPVGADPRDTHLEVHWADGDVAYRVIGEGLSLDDLLAALRQVELLGRTGNGGRAESLW